MRTDRDPVRGRWLETLVETIGKDLGRQGYGADAKEFNVLMVVILQELLNGKTREEGKFGGTYAAPIHIGRPLGLSAKTVRRYYVEAARAGLIKVVVAYDRATRRCFPMEIVIRESFRRACGNTDLSNARHFGAEAAKYWAQRMAADPGAELQGFAGDCEFGKFMEGDFQQGPVADGNAERTYVDADAKVAPPAPGPQPMDEVGAKGRVLVDAAKRKAAEKRAADLDAFVVGAAKVWVALRARKGFSEEPPGWLGEKSKLPLAQRRERQELERVFAKYGGKRAAHAWAIFCGGRPETDEKGRLKFIPDMAHKQWTTPDKKPSHFTKHIDLVMDELRKLGWENDVEQGQKLVDFFGLTYLAPASPPPAAYGASHGHS